MIAGAALERLRAAIWLAQAALTPPLRRNPSVHWLFILTMPNAGSTAIAKILQSAPRAVTLNHDGEGQWLIPAMHRNRRRWDPGYHPNYAHVRAVWLDAVAAHGDEGDVVVIEKSPPNIVRHEKLIAAFRAMETRALVFARDPYATCASWHARYGPETIAAEWGVDLALAREDEYFAALGRIWADRARMLDAARRDYGLYLRYEDFCADPEAVVAAIAAEIPLLEGADPRAAVRVKDYAEQPIENMNERQIAALSPAQMDAISEGLKAAPFAVENLGYKIAA